MLDLRYLDFSGKLSVSSQGMAPKAYDGGKFYKASNFNDCGGFYGVAAEHDVIATRYLRALGIPCLRYDGGLARIIYNSAEYETYVNWSEDYRNGGFDVSFEAVCRSSGIRPEERVAFFRRLDSDYLDLMVTADFLVGNRDRHGSNIRLVSGHFAPLFDFNMSLFMPDGTARMHNIMANNYVGTHSLEDNLRLVRNPLKLRELTDSDWENIFVGADYPFTEELKVWLCERRIRYGEICRSQS